MNYLIARLWDTSILSFILSKEEQNKDRSREEKQKWGEKKRPESEGVNDWVSANIPFLLNTNYVT